MKARLSNAERSVAAVVGCAVIPAALLLETTVGQALQARRDGGSYAIDFLPVWQAARDFVHGASPYLSDPSILLTMPQPIEAYVYPPAVAAAFAPFGALPYGVAAGLFTMLSLTALLSSLRVLGVGDWRCYGVALASPAALTAVTQGGLSAVLALLVALTWRHRDSPSRCGIAVGVAIAAKLFLWPLLVWLLLTRRYRAAGVAVGSAALIIAVAWSRLQFAGLSGYATLMHDLAVAEGRLGYGGAVVVGTGTLLSVATVVLVGGAAAAARRTDVGLFSALVVVALLMSPIVWLHYFALFAPLAAIRSRSLGVRWLAPLLLWFHPSQHGGHLLTVALVIFVAVVVTAPTSGRTFQRRRQETTRPVADAARA